MLGLFSKPETVIIKEGWESKEYLNELKKQKPNEKIQEEIKMMEKQVDLEERIMNEFRNGKVNYVVTKDLNFALCGKMQHFDFFVYTPKLGFLIECKNWGNPLERAEENWHMMEIRSVQNAEKSGQGASVLANFDDYFRVLLVTDDPEECDSKWTKEEEPWIRMVTPEELVKTMETMNKGSRIRKMRKSQMIENAHKTAENFGMEPYLYRSRLKDVTAEKKSNSESAGGNA